MISSEDIHELEESSGIPKAQLMENAGKAVYTILNDQNKVKGKRILIVAYHGNNGGDGFVAARHLSDEAEVDVLFMGDESKLKEEARVNFKRLENNDRVQVLALESVDFSDYDIIVDALFGTGIARQITDPLATLIKKLNEAKGHKVSIDIPSGVNPDTGEKQHAWFEPDMIIAMHDIKKGLTDFKDKTVVADIGIK